MVDINTAVCDEWLHSAEKIIKILVISIDSWEDPKRSSSLNPGNIYWLITSKGSW